MSAVLLLHFLWKLDLSHDLLLLFFATYVPAGTIWLHQTNLEGSVPEEMCILPAVMTDFRTDCHKDRQVQCTCCTSCYGI